MTIDRGTKRRSEALEQLTEALNTRGDRAGTLFENKSLYLSSFEADTLTFYYTSYFYKHRNKGLLTLRSYSWVCQWTSSSKYETVKITFLPRHQPFSSFHLRTRQ
jgi:hypothetical protein